MMQVKSFEGLHCWQESSKVAIKTISLCRQSELKIPFVIQNQIIRSSFSISSNIAEGFGRFSDKEFIRFLNIAVSSGYELKSQLITCKSAKILPDDNVLEILGKLESALAKTKGLIRFLDRKSKSNQVQEESFPYSLLSS
jgi:four helix bundle protein